jgi:hypothetical protein
MEQIRTIAQHAGLSQACVARIEQAARVVPKMQATIAFVSGYVPGPFSFRKEVANQAQNELKGFVPCGPRLPARPQDPKPFHENRLL